MAAAPRLRRKESTLKPGVAGEKLPNLLKVAAIYGPNASGKSTLLRAMHTVPNVARRTPEASSGPLPVWPFRYDRDLLDKPSSFQYDFIVDKLRYRFVVDMTTDRIIREVLIRYPRGKEDLLYSRIYEDGRYQYSFGKSLEGSPDVHEAWKQLTGPKVLLLSQAVANSSEQLTQLKAPFSWLTRFRSTISNPSTSYARSIPRLLMNHPILADEMVDFLSRHDIPVVGLRFEEKDSVSKVGDPDDIERPVKGPELRIFLTHRSALGDAEFLFHEESEGTKALMGFWLPWSTKGDGDDRYCQILAVDELDSSLHPKIVESLIRSHLNLDTTVQVIFTTHDTHLMNSGLLRRDQIWLTERDANAATQLRSVHDFQGREGEDIEKRYYDGRYRALPILSE